MAVLTMAIKMAIVSCILWQISTVNCKVQISEEMPTDSFVLHRFIRDVQARQNTCKVPNEVETYALNCTKYYHKIDCDQECIWGFVHDDGTDDVRHLSCNFTEDVWTPTGFEECRKFVNCKIKMTSPGKVNCTYNDFNEPDRCHISCLPWDKYNGTPVTHYSCKLDSGWSPDLPYCVSPIGNPLLITNFKVMPPTKTSHIKSKNKKKKEKKNKKTPMKLETKIKDFKNDTLKDENDVPASEDIEQN